MLPGSSPGDSGRRLANCLADSVERLSAVIHRESRHAVRRRWAFRGISFERRKTGGIAAGLHPVGPCEHAAAGSEPDGIHHFHTECATRSDHCALAAAHIVDVDGEGDRQD